MLPSCKPIQPFQDFTVCTTILGVYLHLSHACNYCHIQNLPLSLSLKNIWRKIITIILKIKFISPELILQKRNIF